MWSGEEGEGPRTWWAQMSRRMGCSFSHRSGTGLEAKDSKASVIGSGLLYWCWNMMLLDSFDFFLLFSFSGCYTHTGKERERERVCVTDTRRRCCLLARARDGVVYFG